MNMHRHLQFDSFYYFHNFSVQNLKKHIKNKSANWSVSLNQQWTEAKLSEGQY